MRIAKKCSRWFRCKSCSSSNCISNRNVYTKSKNWGNKVGSEWRADEIDMVISRGHFLAGDYNFVFDEIAAVKEACGDAHLKVILETGELRHTRQCSHCFWSCHECRSRFYQNLNRKNSTCSYSSCDSGNAGSHPGFYYATGKKIGMKPAGGIATAKLALNYLVVLRETLGHEWLNADMFRFGASALANDLLMQIVKEETGVYQSIDYFSKD